MLSAVLDLYQSVNGLSIETFIPHKKCTEKKQLEEYTGRQKG